jgi:hypothetical protein
MVEPHGHHGRRLCGTGLDLVIEHTQPNEAMQPTATPDWCVDTKVHNRIRMSGGRHLYPMVNTT